MLCIKNDITDSYFNLAAEEYVLKNISDNCFMLWRNKPCIVVGKHQNTLAEVNYEYVQNNNIKVVRRLSGGGAVFHDLGNLNFTFIQNAENNGNLVDFRRYTDPIIEVLHQLGIDATFEGRNDILINGKKISGNAEHIFKNRVLHHGTLLFSSKMEDLSKALKTNPLKYKDKSVKSVRSRVTNICNHLPQKISVLEFYDKILQFILDSNTNASVYEYSKKDHDQINKLVKEKYSTWEWNFGYSPKYNFKKLIKTNGGSIEIQMNIEKGYIRDLKIFGDFFNERDISEVEDCLTGKKHEIEEIRQTLNSIVFEKYFHNISIKEFLSAMF